MPTYQYKCTGCESTFEEMQRISDPPLEACPSCGQRPERIISGGAGLIFRGSGFYLTDYKGAGKAPGSEKGESSEKQSGKTDQSSSTASASTGTPTPAPSTPAKSDTSQTSASSSPKKE